MGVEIDTCAFQTGCQLSNADSGMSLGLCFLTQFQWHSANVLDSWQLVVLPQSGGHEFNPLWVHNNLSVPLWVNIYFPVPGHKKLNQRIWLITIIRRFRRFWFSIWMMSCIQYICICICTWYMAKPYAGITAMGGGVSVGFESLCLKESNEGAFTMLSLRLFHSGIVLR